MNFGLRNDEIEQLRAIFRQHAEIKRVRIYGSRAMGNYRNNSDIDLALWGNIDPLLLGTIKAKLDALPLPYLFDLTVYDDISHLPLKEHIDQHGKLFYSQV